ncbi:MAG: hypothetical protein ABIB47_06215 [Candidatus Woesearchaeota archaeon]
MPIVPTEIAERNRSEQFRSQLDARKVANLELRTVQQLREGRIDAVKIPNLTESQADQLKGYLSASLGVQGSFNIWKVRRNGDSRYALQVSKRSD